MEQKISITAEIRGRPEGIYMQAKLVTQLSTAEVRQIARSAANSDESLDTANVFPIGTDRHAVFTTEYLSQLNALEEVARELQRSFPF